MSVEGQPTLSDVAVTYDRSRLDDICAGNEELRKRILDEFVRSSPDQVRQLREKLSINDQSAVSHIAHGLKGSSRAIGANLLGNLCEELERGSSTQAGDRLEGELQRIFEAIKAHEKGV